MKPVMYLDVDDTLISYNKGFLGQAAPGAKDFLLWAVEHYEVRWLTAWCPSGNMYPPSAIKLGQILDVIPQLILAIHNPLPWHDLKTEGIHWAEAYQRKRPWIWIEDDLLHREIEVLHDRKAFDYYKRVNVTEDPHSLQKLFDVLRQQVT